MIERHIILEDIDPVVFYGVGNGHLQIIKSLYPKLRIVARDNVIRVLGDEEEMAAFEENVEKMRRHVLKFNNINDEDILDIIKGKQTKATSSTLLPRERSLVPMSRNIFEGLPFVMVLRRSSTPWVVSPLMPRFLACGLPNSSAHSPPLVMLLPRKMMSLLLVGNTSKRVAR